jgi:hypothetical protein
LEPESPEDRDKNRSPNDSGSRNGLGRTAGKRAQEAQRDQDARGDAIPGMAQPHLQWTPFPSPRAAKIGITSFYYTWSRLLRRILPSSIILGTNREIPGFEGLCVDGKRINRDIDFELQLIQSVDNGAQLGNTRAPDRLA